MSEGLASPHMIAIYVMSKLRLHSSRLSQVKENKAIRYLSKYVCKYLRFINLVVDKRLHSSGLLSS